MFVGIDLGTTNSVIAFSKVKSDGRVVANPIDIERNVAAGIGMNGDVKYTKSRDKTLPSFVYYGEKEPIVGDYARDQYKKYPESVVKSVKSQMGQPYLTGYSDEIPDKTPEAVSARILSHLKKKAEIQNRCRLDHVIITVPANFDAAQREATMKAAELAGFDVNMPDGRRKQILISEPNAVLYDISQKLMNGEISDTVLDLSSKKRVMVFDIGGGTLDVTFHELARDAVNPEKLNISEISTSRYTRLAGDDFDRAIAEKLFDRCLAKLTAHDPAAVKRVTQSKAMVLKLLTVAAEQLKIDMSNYVENGSSPAEDDWFGDFDTSFDEEISAEVSQGIGDERIYNDTITKSEFEEMIRPFMGYEYQYSDYKNYSSNPGISRNNIIAPILDVLEKAERYYKNRGESNFHVDAVILNGGMSKLYLIRERLKAFFGLEPITTADPDLSVANGAAIYACIYAQMFGTKATEPSDNRRKNLIEIVRRIQNDSLYIGLAGGATEQLIAEGTELPFTTEITGFKLNAGGKTVEIPIKRGVAFGEMPTIARGKITFSGNIRETTPLKIEASFDTTGLLSIKAHLVNESGVLVGSGAVEIALGEEKTEKIKGAATKIRPRDGAILDAKNEIHMLFQLYNNNDKKSKQKTKRKSNWMSRVKAITETIENCGNPQDFEPVILQYLNSNNPEWFKVSLMQISCMIAETWSEAGKAELKKYAARRLDNDRTPQSPAWKTLCVSAEEILTKLP